MPSSSLLRLVSWLCMGCALSLAIYAGSNYAFDVTTQSELASAWDSSHRTPAAAPSSGGGDFGNIFQVQRPRLAVGQPLAKISVPSVKWSGVILEGNDPQVLSGGPGHQVGTAYPGEPDNMVVSNHNTYSMQFADLKPGAQIVVDADYGEYTYIVTELKVISASDRNWTGHTGKAQITFTTCWPLWAGALAQQRYVIRGDLK